MKSGSCSQTMAVSPWTSRRDPPFPEGEPDRRGGCSGAFQSHAYLQREFPRPWLGRHRISGPLGGGPDRPRARRWRAAGSGIAGASPRNCRRASRRLETTLPRARAEEATTLELADRMRAMFNRLKSGEAPEMPAECKSNNPKPELEREPELTPRWHRRRGSQKALSLTRFLSRRSPKTLRTERFSQAWHKTCCARCAGRSMRSRPLRILARATLTREAERLRFAADRIGMHEWRDALAAFVGLG